MWRLNNDMDSESGGTLVQEILHWNYQSTGQLQLRTVDCTEHVRVLYAKENGLTSVPQELERMEHLEELHLDRNFLDRLDSSVFKLKFIKVLGAVCNRITYVSEDLGQLSETLTTLDLSHNDLQELPQSLGLLVNLSVLRLRGNGLSHFPNQLLHLSSNNLHLIDLSHNNIKKLPEDLAILTGLETFLLRGNRLNHLPECITRLPKLRLLDVASNQLRWLPLLPLMVTEARLICDHNSEVAFLPFHLACQQSRQLSSVASHPSAELTVHFNSEGCFQQSPASGLNFRVVEGDGSITIVPWTHAVLDQIAVFSPSANNFTGNLVLSLKELCLRTSHSILYGETVETSFAPDGLIFQSVLPKKSSPDHFPSLPRLLLERLASGPSASCSNPNCPVVMFFESYLAFITVWVDTDGPNWYGSFGRPRHGRIRTLACLTFCSASCTRQLVLEGGGKLEKVAADAHVYNKEGL